MKSIEIINESGLWDTISQVHSAFRSEKPQTTGVQDQAERDALKATYLTPTPPPPAPGPRFKVTSPGTGGFYYYDPSSNEWTNETGLVISDPASLAWLNGEKAARRGTTV